MARKIICIMIALTIAFVQVPAAFAATNETLIIPEGEPAAKSISVQLNTDTLIYTGKSLTAPSPSVKNQDGKTLACGTDYDVSADSPKDIGTYHVYVTPKGEYASCSREILAYRVVPKGTAVKKVKRASSKKAIVKWKKQKVGTGGYEIRYSTNKNFGSYKAVRVSKSRTQTTIKKLKKSKTYYFKIATYKKVAGMAYYSSWSNIKKLKKSR